MESRTVNYSERSGAGAAMPAAAAARRPSRQAERGAGGSILGWPAEVLQALKRRFGKGGATLIVGLVVCAVVTLFLYAPLRSYYAACRKNEQLTAQLEALNTQNELVSSQIEALQTQEGIEDEARRRGYVEVGATPVNVTGLPGDDTEGELAGNGAIELQQAEQRPWLTVLLDFIFQYKSA